MSENIEKRGGSALSNLGGKALAVGILLVAAWVLIKIAIGASYPLQDAAQAHRDIEARKVAGSVLLVLP